MAVTVAISNPQSFHAEAQFQRVCATCGKAGVFEAHHVVSKQRLKREGYSGLLYDTRNALRLCPDCHGRFTGGTRIPTHALTDDNMCFTWLVLGPAGQNYLERLYTGIDRRFSLHLDRKCPLCQLPPKPLSK